MTDRGTHELLMEKHLLYSPWTSREKENSINNGTKSTAGGVKKQPSFSDETDISPCRNFRRLNEASVKSWKSPL